MIDNKKVLEILTDFLTPKNHFITYRQLKYSFSENDIKNHIAVLIEGNFLSGYFLDTPEGGYYVIGEITPDGKFALENLQKDINYNINDGTNLRQWNDNTDRYFVMGDEAYED